MSGKLQKRIIFTVSFFHFCNAVSHYFSILETLKMNDSKIMCNTGNSSEPRNLTKLVVVIDTSTTLQLIRTFQYLPDPTFDISNKTLKALERLV